MNVYNPENYLEHQAALKFYDSADGQIAYLDEGEGDPYVLIHGVPTSSWLYRKITNQLVLSGKRVIAIDLIRVWF